MTRVRVIPSKPIRLSCHSAIAPASSGEVGPNGADLEKDQDKPNVTNKIGRRRALGRHAGRNRERDGVGNRVRRFLAC